MVDANRTLVMDVSICPHGSRHVDVAVVVKTLLKVFGIALHIAEMREDDSIAESPDAILNVCSPGSQRTLAVTNSVAWALDQTSHFL